MSAIGTERSSVTPYYIDDSSGTIGSAVPERGSSSIPDADLPRRGDSFIPASDTPTAALPRVNEQGVATGGGRLRAGWHGLRSRLARLFCSGCR